MKPSLPKGTRDFNSEQVRKRKFITDIITKVYEKFGYAPLQTPAMEKLSTLTGKYGSEGDRLLFKILKSGDYLKSADPKVLAARDAFQLLPSIAEKGLRYDLTVPFARFVVQNHHALAMPFRRYQIQPVWRADRPQKSRYQEFWQCDADVIGSNSLINELEFIQIYDEVFDALGIDAVVRINNRKLLNGIASYVKAPEFFNPICVCIDKLDKIGAEGVSKDLINLGLREEQVSNLMDMLQMDGANMLKLNEVAERFSSSFIDPSGVDEMRELLSYLFGVELKRIKVEFDLTLARGLSYYTGTIFEVIAPGHSIGSISGGGRYDNLTGVFGLPKMSGVGISFGLDRIFDILEEDGWPSNFDSTGVEVLFCCMDSTGIPRAIECLTAIRAADIKAEMYPDVQDKMNKKMKFANKKKIPFVIILGEDELNSGQLSMKDMSSGEQEKHSLEDLISKLASS